MGLDEEIKIFEKISFFLVSSLHRKKKTRVREDLRSDMLHDVSLPTDGKKGLEIS